jgi:hypothetical protein
MARHKGIVYQRKGRDGASKSQANFPKVTKPPPITNLSIDLGSWISNAKILVRPAENSFTKGKIT